MRKLVVKDFSCIKNASIVFSRITLFIGPQASGKSVLCKLAYFFTEAAFDQSGLITQKKSIEDFKSHVKEKFIDWFPCGAWGREQFRIEFESGNYKIAIARKVYRSKIKDDIRITLSEAFEAQYALLEQGFSKVVSGMPKKHEPDSEFMFEYKFRDQSRKSLEKIMGADYVSTQMFVPAGRSFFTSMDKAIGIFEQSRVIDPLILRFGRLYTTYKNERPYYEIHREERLLNNQLIASMEELFGGKLIKEGSKEYVQAIDGRKMPLTSLSSGQQELLPLLAIIPFLLYGRQGLVYIEEPEAHLFPKSQSALIAALVTLVNSSSRTPRNLVLTTHSPYVLMKINCLIKAGAIGRKTQDGIASKVESIVPRRTWLNGKFVKAYAICEGEVKSIDGHDGLIDADYLDGISGEIAEEFGRLLEVEYQ
ncbi:ATP-binding protein [Comamonadaceae bacterium PP-2]